MLSKFPVSLKILLSLLISVAALVIVACMYNPFTKSSNKYEVVETRDFSCSGMEGFTFRYPVFRNWENITIEQSIPREIIKNEDDVSVIDPNHCTMTINWSGFSEIPPMAPPEMIEPIKPPPFFVEITKLSGIDARIRADITRNPAGIEFYQTDKQVTFIVADYFVMISLSIVVNDEYFSSEQFFKAIIESFKLTPATVSLEQASAIAQEAIVKNNPNEELVIQTEKTIQKEYGWIFFYTTKKYLETRDPKYLIPGNGPIIVTHDGSTKFLTASISPDQAIQEYEDALKQEM
jgi:hypothetical protein